MDVFQLHRRLVDDYAAYTRSFLTIRDERIREHVEAELESGLLWPEPLVQLNPTFAPGETIDELVDAGLLHPDCRAIFRRKRDPADPGEPLRLHRHQADAIRAAARGDHYVLTTGTGSGKSLAYLVPIVDRVLRTGPGQGIQAIIVYPMNALANSQAHELGKFLRWGFPDQKGPVSFARYTGQESHEERAEIISRPPDILLTNYVMLELMLTRPDERPLVDAARGLDFFVLDELHTYRGRQGADIALLVRRVREATGSTKMRCVGTSATLAGAGTLAEQQAEIARVAATIFGVEFRPDAIIGETLERATQPDRPDDPAFVAALRERLDDPDWQPPDTAEAFAADPLASWAETTFGLEAERTTGRLVRARPIAIGGPDGAAGRLAQLTGSDPARCAEALRRTLEAGVRLTLPGRAFPIFAFRIHQFFGRGDAVYASLEPEDRRHVTTVGQQYVPGDRGRILLPLAFCRECGQEYYTVTRDRTTPGAPYEPRDLGDTTKEEGIEKGFLYLASDAPWPNDPTQQAALVPEDWTEIGPDGAVRIRSERRGDLPQLIEVGADGCQTPGGLRVAYVDAPFRFCLRCGVTYGSRQTTDLGKLTTLGVGGRSSATTVLCLSAVRGLRSDTSLEPAARKLLSFTDNRQDASLQAGHFNDFVEVGLLRSALYRAALVAGETGLAHDELAMKVTAELGLDRNLYARDPQAKFAARDETDRALRDVVGYRLYRDLERGWRVTAPNLEQSGLLEIRYVSLDELVEAREEWAECHPALARSSPSQRREVAKALLDHLRRELAIDVEYLNPTWQDSLKLRSSQHLVPPWAIDEGEELVHAAIAYPRSIRRDDYGGDVFLSARGGIGLYLRRPGVLATDGATLTLADTEQIIRELLGRLAVAGLVTVVQPATDAAAVPGYRLKASAMRWVAGSGETAFRDPVRVPRAPAEGQRTNPYFVRFYQGVAADGAGITAREHTAQVSAEAREEREQAFREGRLPLLFCSPTMELGVDIAELNVVNMRNVPPTPANYAQRSGRAGRSGRPALVFNYCTTGSPHDQYFFRRPWLMVSGQVRPPRLDLANEDLVRSHIHAIWLAEIGLSLGTSLARVLVVEGERPSLELRPDVRASIESRAARDRAKEKAKRLLASIPDLDDADWYTDRWLDDTLDAVALSFDRACDRWRDLYRAALETRDAQHAIAGDASRSQADREQARRLRAEAESQLELLRTSGDRAFYSDFYSYRYFASEGFLPGYSFPRLPLSAYIPGRTGPAKRDDYLSRPRFLAISEFGPRSIIYHEGSRYVINKVILPPRRIEDNELPKEAAKRCDACGYLHPVHDGQAGPDLCRACGALLPAEWANLFRLQNVATRRRDRINSDEEERQRRGFEVRTALRFAEHGATRLSRSAIVTVDGQRLLSLEYGGAATIWRINVGWRRRRNPDLLGFVLDTERGYWAKDEQHPDDRERPNQEDPMSPLRERVIPYVEDRRNALLVRPLEPLDTAALASLAAALKTAIQIEYQLEDTELAVEPLPSEADRRLLLFYEAAEGGAGVLRQLVQDPYAIRRLARSGLEVCHFDPETGDDRRRAPGAREDCEAACYDCLMSYGNQRDHRLLDRRAIAPLLLQLTRSVVEASPAPDSRQEHLARLKATAGSDLERRWLDEVERLGLELPTDAQPLVAECNTRADFEYRDPPTLVFIDGPVHDQPDIREHDRHVRARLEERGYLVVTFRHDEPWESIFARYPSVFGSGR